MQPCSKGATGGFAGELDGILDVASRDDGHGATSGVDLGLYNIRDHAQVTPDLYGLVRSQSVDNVVVRLFADHDLRIADSVTTGYTGLCLSKNALSASAVVTPILPTDASSSASAVLTASMDP